MPEVLPDVIDRLIALAASAIQNPRLWYAAALAGFASASLPFLKQVYATHQHETSRRHIADHVAQGKITPEEAVALLGEASRGALSAEGFHTAGWVLGPLGGVLTVAGVALGTSAHPGFFALAFGGAASLALSFSFLVIASAKRKPQGKGPQKTPEDSSPRALPERRQRASIPTPDDRSPIATEAAPRSREP